MKVLMRTLILSVFIFSLFSSDLFSQWSVKITEPKKNVAWNHAQYFTEEEWNASNFASPEEMKWFNDARYGMFIHFGLSTYIGKDLSWGMCYTRKAPDRGHGPIADSVWIKYPEKFVFENFDARKWVEIAQRAGMKYIVTIAKHHDGFHMWDTEFSDFKVTNTPFGRDYLKEIADACHEVGMKFGIYYSQRDWYHPDYSPVDTALIDVVSQPPFFQAKEGVKEVKPGSNHQRYIDYQFDVVRELCTKYGKVDIFWFDACWWGGMFTADMWESERLTRMIRELQPGIIINNRASIPGDFDTPEQKIGMYQERPWESCLTLCHSWSWSDTPVKSKKKLINIITATATGNGNALLSWGSKWDGAFDSKQIERLEEVGDWLQEFGFTIYNTKGGPWYPESWGGSTYRDNKVWIHLNQANEYVLKLGRIDNKLLAASSLNGGDIDFKQSETGEIDLGLDKMKKDSISNIIELTFLKPVEGMAENQAFISKFNAPTYGSIISEKAKIGLSSRSELDRTEQHDFLLGETELNAPFAFITKEESLPSVTLDLGRNYNVKGIEIINKKAYAEKPGVFKLQVSSDAKNWKTIEEKSEKFKIWEVVLSQFNAGIDLPGISARYIKIELEANGKKPLHLYKIRAYGEVE